MVSSILYPGNIGGRIRLVQPPKPKVVSFGQEVIRYFGRFFRLVDSRRFIYSRLGTSRRFSCVKALQPNTFIVFRAGRYERFRSVLKLCIDLHLNHLAY